VPVRIKVVRIQNSQNKNRIYELGISSQFLIHRNKIPSPWKGLKAILAIKISASDPQKQNSLSLEGRGLG